jgi:hypothetical protein
MLNNSSFLKGLVIHATDGELGEVEEFYFDDEAWGIRYLVVRAGGWFNGRQVLISPISIARVDWTARQLHVNLTATQVKNSPGIDTDQPVSRQEEANFSTYYGYRYYWQGPYLWGNAYRPGDAGETYPKVDTAKLSGDSHLRSSDSVQGYHVDAKDGEVGHVEGFIIDDEVWNVAYIDVATRNWLPGKHVLLSPAWIDRVSWTDSKIYAGMFRDAIQNAPEYALATPITREYENRLYFHYGRPPYWIRADESETPVPVGAQT